MKLLQREITDPLA